MAHHREKFALGLGRGQSPIAGLGEIGGGFLALDFTADPLRHELENFAIDRLKGIDQRRAARKTECPDDFPGHNHRRPDIRLNRKATKVRHGLLGGGGQKFKMEGVFGGDRLGAVGRAEVKLIARFELIFRRMGCDDRKSLIFHPREDGDLHAEALQTQSEQSIELSAKGNLTGRSHLINRSNRRFAFP